MESFLKWLSTPYYFNPSKWFKLKASFSLALLVFVFLYVFRPFSISSLSDNIILEYTLGIGLVSFLSSLYLFFIPSFIFKNFFNEDNWTIGRNLLFIFMSLLFVGSILWVFASFYRTNNHISHISYPLFLAYTYLTGSFPIFLLIVINEKKVRLRREKRAKEIKIIKSKENNIHKKEIIIYAENNKEYLKVVVDKLVYITSQGNYASFFFVKDNDLKEKVLRVTLNKITKELESFDTIIRCHKSYLINKDFIDSISGNARGYLIQSSLVPFQIPVSRSFCKESLEKIAK